MTINPPPPKKERVMASFEEINEVWRLYRALRDKEKFDKLSLDEKLEALRIASIQQPEDK